METIQDIRVSNDERQVKHVGGRVFWVAAVSLQTRVDFYKNLLKEKR